MLWPMLLPMLFCLCCVDYVVAYFVAYVVASVVDHVVWPMLLPMLLSILWRPVTGLSPGSSFVPTGQGGGGVRGDLARKLQYLAVYSAIGQNKHSYPDKIQGAHKLEPKHAVIAGILCKSRKKLNHFIVQFL